MTWCFHKWSKWSQEEVEKLHEGDKWTADLFRQKRYCTKCNKVEIRQFRR